MYSTWENNYADLELFAKTWWDGRGHQLAGPGRLDAGDNLVGGKLRKNAGKGVGAERPAQQRLPTGPTRDPTRDR